MYTISKMIPDTITYKGEIGYLQVKSTGGKNFYAYCYENEKGDYHSTYHNLLGVCIKHHTENNLYNKLKELNLVVF